MSTSERFDVAPGPVRTDDWPVQATDQIVKTVGTVRDKVTGPIQTFARGIVFGTFALILGVVAFTLFLILAVRLLDNYLPDAVFGEDHVWASYTILGLIFSLVALVLWNKRVAPSAPS